MTLQKASAPSLRGSLRLNVFRQLGALDRDLLAGCEVLERELVRLDFVLSKYERKLGVELARRLQRLLQLERFAAELDDNVVAAQLASETSGFPVHAGSERRDVNVRRLRDRFALRLL